MPLLCMEHTQSPELLVLLDATMQQQRPNCFQGLRIYDTQLLCFPRELAMHLEKLHRRTSDIPILAEIYLYLPESNLCSSSGELESYFPSTTLPNYLDVLVQQDEQETLDTAALGSTRMMPEYAILVLF